MSDKLVWTQVDESKLSEKDAKLLATYRKAAKEAATAREAFNAAFQVTAKAKIPAGHEMLIGHNFGKLSVAFAEAGKSRSKGNAKPMFTF